MSCVGGVKASIFSQPSCQGLHSEVISSLHIHLVYMSPINNVLWYVFNVTTYVGASINCNYSSFNEVMLR